VELSACPILKKPIVKDFIVHKRLEKQLLKKFPMIVGGYHGKKIKNKKLKWMFWKM
jgi:hypothetical protein